jgi:hypothetical protein
MVHSFDRSIVRPFVRPNNLCSAVMLPKFRSFVRSIIHRSFIVHIHRSSFVHSPYSSFIQIIFVQPLCCRNSDVRPFVHISYSSFVHSHYSSFVHTTIHHHYSSHYSSLLLFTATIHHRSNPLLLFIDDTYNYFCRHYPLSLFIVTIHRSFDHPKFQLLILHAVQST